MQPFTLKNPVALLIGIAIYFISDLIIPKNNNVILDMIFRTSFITVLYTIVIYFSNLSVDISKTIDEYLMKLGIKI